MPYVKNAFIIVLTGFSNRKEELEPFIFDTPLFVFEHLSRS
jgi:hypothetical protein